jgi:hypothetical protein
LYSLTHLGSHNSDFPLKNSLFCANSGELLVSSYVI